MSGGSSPFRFWREVGQNFKLVRIQPKNIFNAVRIDLPTTSDEHTSLGKPEAHQGGERHNLPGGHHVLNAADKGHAMQV